MFSQLCCTYNDPVGEVTVSGHFQRAEDGEVHVAAADHGEALRGGEDGAALQVGHSLLA